MDFDVVVIGSGPGGYVAAIRCAQLGLKTACVEKDPVLGGTCLNIGCIPSKALLHSTELFASIAHFQNDGIKVDHASYDFNQMMERKRKIVGEFNEGIDYLFKKNKIAWISGLASLESPTTLSVGGKSIKTQYMILATGSEPISLPFLPFDEKRVVSSTGALALQQVPKKLLVVGAGVIGVELGSVYRRLGSEVVFIEFLERICPTLDEAVSTQFQRILEKQGLVFNLSSKVTAADLSSNKISLSVESQGKTVKMEGDVVLVSIGRKAYTKGLNLEKAGVKISDKGLIPIDGYFRSSVPNIFAIGDVVDGPMLAHKASEEGVAVAEIIAGGSPLIDYIAIPTVVYTSPEVAAVGLTEKEAAAYGLKLLTGTIPFSINSRAKCTGEKEGFVKMIAEAETGRLLGIHIIGAHASELISEAVLALEKKVTALELANTPHAHPTLSEAIKEAALAVLKRPINK
ncbi:MAG TPA: dihydrolipoyl dehydrogenase [Rhabdochlamydiaceae bacterium]|nr:dihydrolipoyl dehydrogenase [Rhabdochlamydiaceae bacterium]